MSLISWLVAIAGILIGCSVGIWGFTDVSRNVPIWFLGVPGFVLLVIAAGLEFQKIGTKGTTDVPDRPWVSVFRMDIAPVQVGDFRFIIRFKNTGQSPALDTRVIVNWLIPLSTDPPIEIPATIPADASTIIILPGDDPPMDTIAKGVLTPELVSEIQNSIRTIWIAGRVEYFDHKRIPHTTTFRAAYVPGSNRFRSTDTHAD